jgi:peptidoglycan hydrolase-like protein with peptidoglycan-binding domain
MDAIAVCIAIVAATAVLVNALTLQHVRHPAPLFAEPAKDSGHDKIQQLAERSKIAVAPAPATNVTPVPAPRPEAAAVRAKGGIVLDIQRALAERGYYDGVADGVLGPRTQQAIRDFEQSQKMKPTGEPNEALLARILRARPRGEVTGSVPAATSEPSTKVLAVQRVLSRLGYGPVKFSGTPDAATRGAIERFEKDRGLTRTGEIGERLIAELAVVTGSPVE